MREAVRADGQQTVFAKDLGVIMWLTAPAILQWTVENKGCACKTSAKYEKPIKGHMKISLCPKVTASPQDRHSIS